MKDLIADEYADATTFVVKDPRIALLFPLWEAALAGMNIRCVVAIISRDPLEVAQSMVKRQSLAGDAQPWPLERGGLTWLRYNLAAEKQTRGTRRTFCDYSHLLDDWRSVARDLGDALDVAWPISVAEAAPNIDSFLSNDLRHHRESDDWRFDPGIWSEWIAPVFSQLRAADERRAPDQTILDGVSQSFEKLADSLRNFSSSPSDIPRRQCIRITRRGAGERKICLVGDLFVKSDVGAAAIEAAIAADIDISLVDIGTFAEAEQHAFADLAKRHNFDVDHLALGDAAIQPSFMASSIQLLRYTQNQKFDAIVFQDRNGLGYASAIAKQTGTAFADVSLAVVAFGSAGWSRQENGAFPSNPTTIGTEYIERKAMELADCVVISRPEIGDWMAAQGWQTKSPIAIAERDAGPHDWQRLFEQILHVPVAASVMHPPSEDASDDALRCSALTPPLDYLIGTALEQSRLSIRAALERQTARAIIAAGIDAMTGEVGRYVRSLQTALEERSKAASEAERYATSLEETLARAREENQTATEYARSLEQSRTEMAAYLKIIEAELRSIRAAGNRDAT